uniref:Uncharacterized protein n=1 Tax=viral metagenome TaxID=1070528 RepID=A0A6C0JMH6_9ZZZZ
MIGGTEMSEGNTDMKKEIKDGQIDIITKVSPFIGNSPNRKGFNVGDYKVIVDTKDLPFNDFDQVDKFLSDLIKFTGDYSGKKKPKDYYIYHPKIMSFIPVKVVEKKVIDKQDGGVRKKKRNQKTMKKQSKRNGTYRNNKNKRNRTTKL